MSSPIRSASMGNASSYSAHPVATEQRPLRAFSSFEKVATGLGPLSDFTNIPVRRSASQSMSTKGLHDAGRFVAPRRTFSHDAIQTPHIVKARSSEAKTCLIVAADSSPPADADLSLGGIQQLPARVKNAPLGPEAVAGRYKAMGDCSAPIETDATDQGVVEVFSKMPD